jgi:hypothetical protein
MSDFKTRLETEKVELEEKLDKLNSFLVSEKVKGVDDVQKALLRVQATAMNTYLQCLKERIERL